MSGPAPRIGLALGGGGARGLAHIAMLEVFDDLGLAPAVIAGTSVGALIGAAFASGVPARTIRAHAEEVLGRRTELARRLFGGGPGTIRNLIDFNLFGAVQIDGPTLTRLVLPDGVAARLEETRIPLKVIATDFYARRPTVIDEGPLEAAVAASIALPGFIGAPRIAGRLMIDGGISDPVPFDHVRGASDLVVAIDVTGGPVEREGRPVRNADLVFGASQIMMRTITRLMVADNGPDILIAPDVDRFRVLEFFRVHEILEAAGPAAKQLETELRRAIVAGVRG
jgi:NTE family protein